MSANEALLKVSEQSFISDGSFFFKSSSPSEPACKFETNVKILIALKAFSTLSLAPLISEYLDGCCSSGLYETKLAAKYFRGEVSTFSPAFKNSEFVEIASLSNHVIFNSLNQFNNFYNIAKKSKKEVGIRVNPLYSEVTNSKYNSAGVCSRLGIHINDLKKISQDFHDSMIAMENVNQENIKNKEKPIIDLKANNEHVNELYNQKILETLEKFNNKK